VQLAENFKRLARNEQLLEYTENQPIYVVPIGLAWAVAQVGDKISVDDEGWKIRRDADYFVLSNFLPDAIAKEHWEAAFQIAQI
jgi:hypothetical protein